jgi:hypothetical protein
VRLEARINTEDKVYKIQETDTDTQIEIKGRKKRKAIRISGSKPEGKLSTLRLKPRTFCMVVGRPTMRSAAISVG